MVPLSFGCGSAVFAAIATLAPSRAARSAMASPMPRLAPDTNSVLPLRDAMMGRLQLWTQGGRERRSKAYAYARIKQIGNPGRILIVLSLPRRGCADRERRAGRW